jgi:large subunit ribosomal protein L15
MKLHDVHRGIKGHRKLKRVGRGEGSGHGKTSGRGHKGQTQLAGWTAPAIFEGGSSPLIRRIPKRGFNNRFALTVAVVNLRDLEKAFESGDEVSPDTLRAKGILKRRFDVLKVLATGELTKKLKVSAHRFSAAALEKIQQAGGQADVLPGRAPVEKGVKRENRKKAKAQARTKAKAH